MKFSDFFAESSLSETDSADITTVDNPLLFKKRLDEINAHNLKKIIREHGIKIKDYVETKTIISIEFYKLTDSDINFLEELLEGFNINFNKEEKTLLIFKI
nr:MAG TPA: hypothetical protein [Caudoviricetes sp.]